MLSLWHERVKNWNKAGGFFRYAMIEKSDGTVKFITLKRLPGYSHVATPVGFKHEMVLEPKDFEDEHYVYGRLITGEKLLVDASNKYEHMAAGLYEYYVQSIAKPAPPPQTLAEYYQMQEDYAQMEEGL